MKRVILFLITNLAVMAVLSVVASVLFAVLGVRGNNLAGLLLFAAIFGFGGSFISLFLSKWMAKFSTQAKTIDSPSSSEELWLVDTVRALSSRANLPMPEVAIYPGSPNAFATGFSKNSSLVAVSTGLLEVMNKQEARAVLAHEIAHIQNGDMVTLSLIQGVVNTFVIFFSRLLANIAAGALRSRDSDSQEGGNVFIYHALSLLFEIVFGILASLVVAYFSRQREFRADAGAARLMGDKKPMQQALARLGGISTEDLPQSLTAFGFRGGKLASLFASHPPLEERIEALNHVNI